MSYYLRGELMKAFLALLASVAMALLLASLVLAEEPKRRVQGTSTSASVSALIVEAKPETELEKKQAELMDVCLRIYRRYGHVEVQVIGPGVVICR